MTAVRIQIGGFCIKGGGHVWTFNEDGPDGCSGWDVFIEVWSEEIDLFPDWVREQYSASVEGGSDAEALRRYAEESSRFTRGDRSEDELLLRISNLAAAVLNLVGMKIS